MRTLYYIKATTMQKNIEVEEIKAVIARDIEDLHEICKQSYKSYIIPDNIVGHRLGKSWN